MQIGPADGGAYRFGALLGLGRYGFTQRLCFRLVEHVETARLQLPLNRGFIGLLHKRERP